VTYSPAVWPSACAPGSTKPVSYAKTTNWTPGLDPFARSMGGYLVSMGSENGTGGAGVDSARAAAAMVTSRGLGLGQIEAQRFLRGLTPEQRQTLANDLQEDVEAAQALAQSRAVPVADYVGELVAKGEVDVAGADLDVLYRAGFDVGFTATLVESIGKVASGFTAVE